MAISFDHTVADRFIAVLNRAASELRSQSKDRDLAAQLALLDFRGGYARTVEALVLIESLDRVFLARVLEELSRAVRQSAVEASNERQRRDELEAWYERERARNSSVVALTGPTLPVVYDPQPSTIPIRPQPLRAVFAPRLRDRTPRGGGDGQGISSADPDRLEGFVEHSAILNGHLQAQKTVVTRAYMDFTSACSWVPQDSVTFGEGWGQLIQQNQEDGDLLSVIAHAFRHAGTGTLPTSYLNTAITAEHDANLLIRVLLGMDPQERERYLGSEEFQHWAAQHPMGAKNGLDYATGNGIVPPTSLAYGRFLKSYWQQQSLLSAGIDPLDWDPQTGARANEDIILAVYEYYGALYLQNPDLQWAGMANAMGPSFAAGMMDLAELREFVNYSLSPLLATMPPPPGLKSLNPVAKLTDEEIEFYEAKLLEMQKDIFLDQGMQHQAYVAGGIEEIERMVTAGALPDPVLRVWKDIDSGDPNRVVFGNKQLLNREQNKIIKIAYDEMRNHDPTGEAVTWLMTLLGEPSIPGAKSYPEAFPYEYTTIQGGPESFSFPGTDYSIDNPLHRKVHVTTGMPDGNISNAEDRWALIEEDTWPAFMDLVQNKPQQLQEIVESDVGERIEERRLFNNIPEILDRIREGYSKEYEP